MLTQLLIFRSPVNAPTFVLRHCFNLAMVMYIWILLRCLQSWVLAVALHQQWCVDALFRFEVNRHTSFSGVTELCFCLMLMHCFNFAIGKSLELSAVIAELGIARCPCPFSVTWRICKHSVSVYAVPVPVPVKILAIQ